MLITSQQIRKKVSKIENMISACTQWLKGALPDAHVHTFLPTLLAILSGVHYLTSQAFRWRRTCLLDQIHYIIWANWYQNVSLRWFVTVHFLKGNLILWFLFNLILLVNYIHIFFFFLSGANILYLTATFLITFAHFRCHVCVPVYFTVCLLTDWWIGGPLPFPSQSRGAQIYLCHQGHTQFYSHGPQGESSLPQIPCTLSSFSLHQLY